mmetsp:Transcript_21589/g.28708  ORF Transcript_21589/g.28708 Transcript_21589/m.28708 type:complete len:205 (+) Transcript_21589:96-710(+)
MSFYSQQVPGQQQPPTSSTAGGNDFFYNQGSHGQQQTDSSYQGYTGNNDAGHSQQQQQQQQPSQQQQPMAANSQQWHQQPRQSVLSSAPAPAAASSQPPQPMNLWTPGVQQKAAATFMQVAGNGFSGQSIAGAAEQFGKDFFDEGTAKMIPGFEAAMKRLRVYFGVDNHYVKKKMQRVLFPFLFKQWKRLVRTWVWVLEICLVE